MEKVRASAYLNQVEIGDGTSLLYNGATLCLDLVPTAYAQRLTGQEDGEDLSFLSAEEEKHLLERGHLTNLSRDRELEQFRELARFVLDQENRPGTTPARALLSFVLTYNCNLACSYCYQKSLARKASIPAMSAEFVNVLLTRYLPQMFTEEARKNLRFLLFGGEPLLPGNRAAIVKILEYAEEYGIKVSTATNATTLPAMADLIGPDKGKIQNVQVTLDGDRLLHDTRRVPLSGEPTFDDMIGAIRRLVMLKAHVFVRIHTHPEKVDSAIALVDYLDENKLLGHPDVEVYFAPLNTFGMESGSDDDFAAFCRLFQEVAAKTQRPPSLNLDFLNDILGMQTKTLLPKARFCSLGSDAVRIVDPVGDVYACFEEAGRHERRIGSFASGQLEWCRLNEVYAERHILNIPECLQCSVGFFCGGGCPNQARVQQGSIFRPYCLQNKVFIAQSLKAFFLLSRQPSAALLLPENSVHVAP